MLTEVGLPFGSMGPEQQRAITFLWAATQVATKVVQKAFLQIYSSLPDSENGQTPLEDYCWLAGKGSVYCDLELEGYITDALFSNPKEVAFLDLKVTRTILDRVLAERFGKEKYGKLVSEVRQLVYLRNDLCHQFLPALTFEQYLSRMKQLETRLCVVVSEAALIAGKSHTPNKSERKLHALFASLTRKDKPQAVENGTQTSLQLPATLETATHASKKKARPCTSLHRDKPQSNASTQTDQPPATLKTTSHILDGAMQDKHALSASLPHHHHGKPTSGNRMQTNLHSPHTSEKGTQANMDSQHHGIGKGTCGDRGLNAITTSNIPTSDSQYLGTVFDASRNTENNINTLKNSRDSGRVSVFSRGQGLTGRDEGKTHGGKKREKNRQQKAQQEGQKQGKHEDCCGACPFSPQSLDCRHRDHEGGTDPFSPHGTLPFTKTLPSGDDDYPSPNLTKSPCPHTDGISMKGGKNLQEPCVIPHSFPPGFNLCHDDLVNFKKLTYEAVTMDHVFVRVHDDRLPLAILLSFVLKVVVFLVMVVVFSLPMAITMLRVLLEGVQSSWRSAGQACWYLWELFGGSVYREVMSVSEVVLIPRLDPVELRGPAIAPRQFKKSVGSCYLEASAWKQVCRRKGRRR